MTPALLRSLRETPGCGDDPKCIVRHAKAVEHADECDCCLARLADKVLTVAVEGMPGPLMLPDLATIETVSTGVGCHVFKSRLVESLRAALRGDG